MPQHRHRVGTGNLASVQWLSRLCPRSDVSSVQLTPKIHMLFQSTMRPTADLLETGALEYRGQCIAPRSAKEVGEERICGEGKTMQDDEKAQCHRAWTQDL